MNTQPSVLTGVQAVAHIEEELSSSSMSSTSRASLDAPSSSPSFSGDHILPFQGDSSGSM
ncbi:hypothetical protein Bhyg_11423 [Pseudolycoriella hygida]|uniref:Uncharacterized protein n=1 Tax=Pseudolycoriella hygida TaxID=35572 RepID=A0A9Q0RZX6_9DIPT|nr:hypothetical protein Bhyg_11423 [Pseudolycoriella hygida]